MNFDEWWVEYRGFKDTYDGAAKDAWNAALDVAEKVILDSGYRSTGIPAYEFIAKAVKKLKDET